MPLCPNIRGAHRPMAAVRQHRRQRNLQRNLQHATLDGQGRCRMPFGCTVWFEKVPRSRLIQPNRLCGWPYVRNAGTAVTG